MNAKKIMGAVLVALLAAALFVGAGAAVADGDTVFVNQNVAGLKGTWTSGTNSITAVYDAGTGNGYFTGNVVEGVYVNGTSDNAISITVKYPTAVVSGVAGSGDETAYQIVGNTYYIGSGVQSFSVKPAADGVNIEKIYLTLPNGDDYVCTTTDGSDIKTYIDAAGNNLAVGEYIISVVFDIEDFATGTLTSEVEAKPVSFKVAKAGDVTISASVDQIIRTDNFKVTIVGQPGVTFQVSYDKDDFNFNSNQKGLLYASVTPNTENDGFEFVMPNTGKVEFVIAGSNDAEDSEKITVEQIHPTLTEKNKESVTVKFLKGTITAEADAASYFVGDVVTITGTNTAGSIAGYIIKGTNFEVAKTTQDFTIKELDNNGFEFEIDTSVIVDDDKKLDVGTYTITIYIGPADKPTAKATVAVVLKQPFISIVDAPEVIVQDTKVEFVINAEAVKVNGKANPYITYYLFGTNFFDTGFGEQDEDVETNYIVTLDEDYTENMSAGQYFAVFQHPMYDGVFNVTGDADSWWISVNDAKTINVKERQTANAAQALCDALDIQSIDDMYVKYSFFVVGEDESFTISEIPATIAQGETLTISGVSTANAGEYVTVEMISTAFAAVPKETVGSAAFIAVTTQIADDGTWEVTFDTSNLNVDEYSLSVACTGEDKPWKNVEINVVEAADKPDTPVTPPADDEPGQDEPVAPETPGFGALAALAGLGAVAVLLLRRE